MSPKKPKPAKATIRGFVAHIEGYDPQWNKKVAQFLEQAFKRIDNPQDLNDALYSVEIQDRVAKSLNDAAIAAVNKQHKTRLRKKR